MTNCRSEAICPANSGMTKTRIGVGTGRLRFEERPYGIEEKAAFVAAPKLCVEGGYGVGSRMAGIFRKRGKAAISGPI
jgi:hypothetical protein